MFLRRTLLLQLATCLTLLHNIHASLTDKATGISFLPRIHTPNGELEITGVGVRKKGPIKVYSVGMYTTAALKESLSQMSKVTEKIKALATLRQGAGSTERPVSFLLEMSFKAGAEKMASAIADSVAPRHKGPVVDVENLKSLILEGVTSNTKDGIASKGTKFQFDCSGSGVGVSINGKGSGNVDSSSLSSAFCDVYLDDKAVSPALKQNCLDNCCQE